MTKTERIAADELDIKDPSTNRLISRRSQWAAVPGLSVLFKGDYPRFDSEKYDSPDQASRLRPALDGSGYRLSTSCSRGGGGGAPKRRPRIRRPRQPRPRREETWNAVVQSLPHRTFGTNSQRKEQKRTLRLADGDTRGSVQLWRLECAVGQTHTRLLSRHPLGIVTTSGFPPQWSLVDEDDGFLSLPRPFLPVVAMRERSVPPPSSHLRSSKQQQHAEAAAPCICQRGRRESGRLRRASLPATLLYGRSHVSVSPGVQDELSYPTHASRGRATRRCELAVQWEEEEEEPGVDALQQQLACCLPASQGG
ncbi:hypothetical protein B0T18DRAFT_227384 [Schizothecium vesticola]|uniref:Uncharacterized protein n=1 Tax=Schizothecium vesticola TaxID=314040 RepID=A0AA40EKW2_9PEZI|nr:hypothetical protein B0T18DRAFT_227384 [Schizothecium vesticola]